jgi:hypothetical protein
MMVCATLVSATEEIKIPDIRGKLQHCVRCGDWVRPSIGSVRRMSSKSNLPGLWGVVKTVACCPQCDERL